MSEIMKSDLDAIMDRHSVRNYKPKKIEHEIVEFLIRLKKDGSVEFIDKGGVLSQVDLGIVKCHFEIGSGKTII